MEQAIDSLSHLGNKAFTLIELLVVMSIMAIIAALAAPSVTSMLSSSTLEQAGQMVGDTISLARQKAVSNNREIEVAFLELPIATGGKGWKALQIWEVIEDANGIATKPISRIFTLPDPIIFTSGSLSPLISSAPLSGNASIGGSVTAYRAFRFRANGAVDSSIGLNNYVTIQNANAQGDPPANYFTVQVNPVTGKVTNIRP